MIEPSSKMRERSWMGKIIAGLTTAGSSQGGKVHAYLLQKAANHLVLDLLRGESLEMSTHLRRQSVTCAGWALFALTSSFTAPA